MAGNVSAFSTVWTYDLYGAYINKKASDKHSVYMGRWSTVIGMLISIGTAYLVANASSIMDYVQALCSFFIAPLFGTVILGMLWKRATRQGGFWGLLAGTLSSIGMFAYVQTGGKAALAHIALSADAQPMAENMYRALWSWLICVAVTIVVSVGDIVVRIDAFTDAEVDSLVGTYWEQYSIAAEHDRVDSLRVAAKIDLVCERFWKRVASVPSRMHGLGQLPGIAVQRLMAGSYGFAGECDQGFAGAIGPALLSQARGKSDLRPSVSIAPHYGPAALSTNCWRVKVRTSRVDYQS